MSELYTLKALVGSLLILLPALFVYQFYTWHHLSHIPGPFWASFSKYWMVSKSLKGQMHSALQDVNNTYGSVARIGPNNLVTNDPDILRRTMAVRSNYTRGPWYDAMKLDPTRDNLVSMRDEDAHMKLRNKMAAGYSGKENESMESAIDEQVSLLIDLIERKYISTRDQYRPMEFGEKAQFFTLDVISRLAFGQSFGYLPKDKDGFQYIKMVEASLPTMVLMANVPWIARLTQTPLFRGLFPKASDKFGFGAFIGIANQLTHERFLPDSKPQKDMMGSFIRHGLTEQEVAGEALLQIIAGNDTTAATVRMVLLNLMTSPPYYLRLRAEIDSAITAGNISSPIKDSEAKKLPYLQAVIREGLRMNPPASGLFSRQVPEGGDNLNGIFVPGGTQLGFSVCGIQQSKEVFGEDADTFRPERWLEAMGEQLARMQGSNDLVFNYGRFQCLGKSVALMELNKVFVELLRRYDFAIVNASQPAKIFNAGIWIISDFWVRIEKRFL